MVSKILQNVSLSKLLEKVLAIGFSDMSSPLRKEEDWMKKFDLRSWKGWNHESLIIKNELFSGGKTQEVVVRLVLKNHSELGHSAIPAMTITFSRSMPLGEWNAPPKPLTEFVGCFWEPVFMRYYASPSKIHEILTVDPGQSSR